MLLLSIARRIQISHLQYQLPPLLFHSITLPSSPHPPCRCPGMSFFFAAFHRTPSIRSETSIHCTTLQSFYTQTLNDPFELIGHKINATDPLQSDLLESLKRAAHFPAEKEAMAFLDESGIRVNQNLVFSAIWELRKQWKLAFLAFKWGEKWGCVDQKAIDLMVWVLGNNRKFSIAWTLIRDFHRSSMNVRRTMLIMIESYAAANDPGKAIRSFHIMEKFRLTPDEEAFYFVVNALCKYGNIEEAEEFMFVNKNLFPLETEGFNIILSAWCNVCVDVLEAKRVWREMSKCCITPNATSYAYMISCFSKVGNLFDALRLYDEMKKRGWVPGLEVYNSLIYVLTCENCFREALKIVDKIKEAGLQPDCSTYNSMIRPLCQARNLEEARNILATMTEENLSPTKETYHAFLEGETSFEVTLEVLNQMKIAGLGPGKDTFLLILAKVFRLEQAENALMIWSRMKHHGVKPEMMHYTVLVEGLASCGLLSKAAEYYAEMRSHGFRDDPKLLRMLDQLVHDKLGHKKLLGKQVQNEQHAIHQEGRMSKWNSLHGGSKERRHGSNSLNRKYTKGKRSQERPTMKKLQGRQYAERKNLGKRTHFSIDWLDGQ